MTSMMMRRKRNPSYSRRPPGSWIVKRESRLRSRPASRLLKVEGLTVGEQKERLLLLGRHHHLSFGEQETKTARTCLRGPGAQELNLSLQLVDPPPGLRSNIIVLRSFQTTMRTGSTHTAHRRNYPNQGEGGGRGSSSSGGYCRGGHPGVLRQLRR